MSVWRRRRRRRRSVQYARCATLYDLPIYNKVLIDTSGRMVHTLNVMRACRVFNYKIAGDSDLLAARNEMIGFHFLPPCIPLAQLLKTGRAEDAGGWEVDSYHRIAIAELEKPKGEQLSLWSFWQSNAHRCFREGAALVASSASIERAFSVLENAVTDQQEKALKD